MYRGQFDGVDWVDLLKRLEIRAKSLTIGASATFDCGISWEDLRSETLETFFKSENGLGWDAQRGPLHVFLGKVLLRKFIDHYRRQKRHGGGSLDSDPALSSAAA